MKIGIIAAMQVELDSLLANCEIIESKIYFGRTIYVAKFKNNNLILGVSGIGKVNASSFAQLLIDKYEIDMVINTGIAGSLMPWLNTMSMVIANNLAYYDFPIDILKSTYPGLASFPADASLISMALDAIPHGTRVEVGTIATGDEFVSSTERKLSIVEKTNALACDMESAAIAQIAYGCNVRCLIIRTISDSADENAEQEYDNFEMQAANLSVKVLLELLEQI